MTEIEINQLLFCISQLPPVCDYKIGDKFRVAKQIDINKNCVEFLDFCCVETRKGKSWSLVIYA